ncbi:MAG: amino acid adenylation domain-containing protein [Janthinobacterium lividum]
MSSTGLRNRSPEPENSDRRPEDASIGRATERLQDRFVKQAAANPERPALVHDGRSWRYRDLDEQSNQLAHALRSRGVYPGSFVAICMERSAELVIAILAVLKAGAAYVPIDPAYPAERIANMMADSAPSHLVTVTGLISTVSYAGTIIDMDREHTTLAQLPLHALHPETDDGGLACVFYTSGSTGRPKGVMLRHTATAMIEWASGCFTNNELARVAATTSVCFDPSIFEIFAPLSCGGTIILKNNLLEPFDPDEQPTLLNGVPSAFAALVGRNGIPDSVQVINVGGERLSAGLARMIYRNSRVDQVWNHYGPTEATICTCVALVGRDVLDDPPIGHAIAGALLYILDEEGRAVEPGCLGELFIGGPNLADGYFNRPDTTAAAFLNDPFSTIGGRMYRTGDLVRRAANGDLLFVGRKGRQVKFRGFRIELDEIELAIRQVTAISDVAVITTEQAGIIHELVAVVVASGPMTLATVRRQVGNSLPAYMLPTRLIVVSSLPLTPTGKIDLLRLSLHSTDAPAAIQTSKMWPIEEVVVNVYRELLRQPGLTQHDDFFENGGDSLLAVAAALALQEVLGHVVPVSLLSHGRTAVALAPLLSPDEENPLHLTTLQPSGDAEPLFCLPDIFGRPLSFLSLSRHFQNQRPVYGLSPGPLERSTLSAPSIARLSQAYALEVERVQATGRITLVGYSGGAIPAIDLACVLQRSGREVLLVLIDPRAQRIRVDLRDRKARYRRVAGTLWTSGWHAAMRSSRRHALPHWIPQGYADLTEALMQAEADWRPQAFQGKTLLALCRPAGTLDRLVARLGQGKRRRGLRGWHPYLDGSVAVTGFDSGHFNIMREPDVSHLAMWLRTALTHC